MSEEEIQKSIKKWDLENDDYFNFNTPKNTYALYCMICFFEHRKLKTTRIKGNKCEIKVFNPNNSLSIHYYSVRDNYNNNLEYNNTKIVDFEII